MFCTPYVKVDLNKVEKNIKVMEQKLSEMHIEHWPHIKSHKCIELAKMQINAGAKGITCANLSEAEIMSNAGINNILIGYTLIGKENIRRLGKLVNKNNIRTTIDSIKVAKDISDEGINIGKKIDVLIELDGGAHRGGIQPGKDVLDFANKVKSFPGINLIGLFAYVGQIYGLPNKESQKSLSKLEAKILLDMQSLLNNNGFNIKVLSGGSTLSSYYNHEIKGITESRAGNYIFGDMNDVHVGIYTPNDCALKIRTTIISKPLPGYATIDAGSKSLTTDTSLSGKGYGYVVDKPNILIEKLNEEHGFLRYNPKEYNLQIGDELEVIPNHCCVVANLFDYMYAFRDNKYIKLLKVDAKRTTNHF